MMQILNSQIVKNISKECGFVECGISKAIFPEIYKDKYQQWILRSYNAGMNYLSMNQELRYNPKNFDNRPQTVISLLTSYYPDRDPEFKDFVIAKYAYSYDYHIILKNRGACLIQKLKNIYPDFVGNFFTDAIPLSERYFAAISGLGFIGKNTCLINSVYGSYVFISEILTNLKADKYDEVSLKLDFNNCGSCNLCEIACPTGALSSGMLDANKCISYHTIESKVEIPKQIADKITNQIFGCDVCQDVCPYNRSKKKNFDSQFRLCSEIESFDAEELYLISNREFNRKYQETALKRAGRQKLLLNYELLKNKNSKPT